MHTMKMTRAESQLCGSCAIRSRLFGLQLQSVTHYGEQIKDGIGSGRDNTF